MILDKAVVDAIAGEPYGTIIPWSYAVGSRRKLEIKLTPNGKRISQNDKLMGGDRISEGARVST